MKYTLLPTLLLGAMLLGTTATRLRAAGQDETYLNGGYYLLHQLYSDESQVSILLMMKSASPNLKAFADKISKISKDDLALLDKMKAADSDMNWDKNCLPPIEQAVRDSIKGEKQHQLLFGTKGPDFARAFLVSQSEASKYAANINKVLAQRDKDPDRVRDLQHMSDQWHAIYNEAFDLMRNY